MKKRNLSVCNWALLLAMPLAVLGGVLLENLHGEAFCGLANPVWVWVHVALAAGAVSLALWHLYLSWKGVANWVRMFGHHRSWAFKLLFIFFFATLLTGLCALPFWLTHGHFGLGGVHGKLGIAFAWFAVVHIVQRTKWFQS